MKTLKYIALGVACLAMASCADNDGSWDGSTGWDRPYGWNTKEGVTVEFTETAVDALENAGVVQIPLEVKGDPNGYVQVKIELIEELPNPAMEKADYYITTSVINLNPEDKAGHVEITTIDHRGLDPDRTFTLRIAEVRGGQPGTIRDCFFTILDKGSSPLYSELAGRWLISGVRYNFNTKNMDDEFSQEVSMVANNPEENIATVQGYTVYPGGPNINIPLFYDYDNEEKYGDLVFQSGCVVLDMMPNYKFTLDLQGGTEIIGKWNTTFTSVSFGNSGTVINFNNVDGTEQQGTYFMMSHFTLSRLDF